jgi:hypothetical protein
MWPTFFIPGIELPARPDIVATACTTGTGINLSLNVQIPSGVQAGDLMIAHAANNALGGATAYTLPSGWVQFARPDRGDNGNFGTVGPIAWKFADSTDAADAGTGTRAFAFNNGTSLRQRVCITAFRDVDSDQPFGAMNLGVARGATSTNGSQAVNCPVIYPSDRYGAILCFVSAGTNTGVDLYENASPINNGDLRGTAENVDDDGTTKQGNLLVLWWPRSNHELENLLVNHYRAFDSWTPINATVDDAFVNGDATITEVTFSATGGVARKAIYKEVTLEAGQPYTLIVYGHRNTTTGTPYIWASFDDGTTEAGGFFLTTASSAGTKGSAIGSPTGHYVFQGSDGGAACPHYCVVTFTPTQSGTHKIWIGASNSNGSLTTTSALSAMYLMYAQLLRGHYAQYPPRADLVVNPASSEITGKTGYAGRIIEGIETANPAGLLAIELRRNAGIYSPMRVDPLYWNPMYISNAAGTGPGAMLFKNTAPSVWRATAPVFGTSWTNTGLGKFYAEVTWSTRQSGAGTAGIGIMDGRTHEIETGIPTTETRTDAYFDDGKIYENGALKGTYSTFTTGDVIGIAVDFGANTCDFYKNGTLVASCTSTLGDYPRWLVIENGGSSLANTDTFTVNLTGPFSYKPTGYQAWDWNNDAS